MIRLRIARNLSIILPLLASGLVSLASAEERVDMRSEARGAKVAAEVCAECHGKNGRGISAEYPSLSGQHAEYILKQIFNFKTGARRNDEMSPALDKLLAADLRAVAQHFSAQPAGRIPATDQALLKLGQTLYENGRSAMAVSPCVACHGASAVGGAQMPRLAGQNVTYLENQMRGFIRQVRKNDQMMHASMAPLTDHEIKALAVFLGNLQ
jgi:cytochrome c553